MLDAAHAYTLPSEGMSSKELSHARSTFLIPLSASNSSSLDVQAARLVASDLNEVNVVDLAYTLGTRRSNLAERGFALVGQKTLQKDLQPDHFQKALVGNYSRLPIAFIFTGQGAQWAQMGKELIEQIPSFRRSIQELDTVLQALPEAPSWTIQNALLEPKESSRINHVTRSQPVCTAVQVAFVQLLAQWDIKPEGVIGHSSGEICAAYAAGRLTAAQAIITAYYRGYVVGKSETTTSGAMMAAALSKEDADSDIETLELTGTIKVACVNSPQSVTISGDASGIDAMIAKLTQRGTFARKLNTNGRAYHSHHMTSVGNEYQSLLEKSLGSLPLPDESSAKWISSVYAAPITGKILPSYWRKNLESPVLFSDALEGLIKGTRVHLIEIGPHSALEMPIKQTCESLKINDAKYHYSSALLRGKDGVHCALNLMGNLFLHGHSISFAKVNHVETSTATTKQGKVLTSLPPYPWSYDGILFNESRSSRELRNRKYGHHDLLGIQTIGGSGLVTTWRNTLRVKDIPWVESHKLGQDIVFPGAGYIAMAMEAITQATGTTKNDAPSFTLRHVNIIKALPLFADENHPGVETFTTLRPTKLSGTTNSNKWFDFEITTFENEKSTTHATGRISVETGAEYISAKFTPEKIDFQELATRNWYDKFARVGLNFGPAFQSMNKIETDRRREQMFARSTVKYLNGGGVGAQTQSDYIMHPITIDTMLQTALVASSSGIISNLNCMVPTLIELARFKAPTSSVEDSSWLVDAVSEPVGPGSIRIAAEIHNGQGQICGQLENVSAVAFQGAREEESDIEGRHPMMRVIWKPDITKLSKNNANGFSTHLAEAAAASSDIPVNANRVKLAAMAGIVAHKNPRVNILELGKPAADFTKHLVRDVLRADTSFKRHATYSRGYFSADAELYAEDIPSPDSVTEAFERLQPRRDAKYDLIIFPNQLDREEYTPERLEIVKSFLTPQGGVLALLPSELKALDISDAAGLPTIEIPIDDASERIIFGKRFEKDQGKPECDPHHVIIIERDDGDAFNDLLIPQLSKHLNQQVERVSLMKLTANLITQKTSVICTIELRKPLLATMSVTEMSSLKIMTDNATNILWITGGGQLDALHPELAMVSGFSRSLILEQPALRFFTFDIDDPKANQGMSVDNILATVDELHSDNIPDSETVEKNGIAHTSRFIPEEEMNEKFRLKQADKATLKLLGQTKPARLTIKSLGQFDTLAFKQDSPNLGELKVDFVEVDVKSVGLNAKVSDLYDQNRMTHTIG